MSQKIPLFNGVIVGAPVAVPPGFVTPIFTPPDAGSRAPSIYEVHLYVSPRELNNPAAGPSQAVASIVLAHEGTDFPSAVSVWRAATNVNVILHPVVKALDGHPVRGDVTLNMLAISPAGGEPFYMWGYYRRVGEGAQVQPERRPIGKALMTPFNAGVPFRVAPGATAIIHIFEQNRIDEISLAAFFETSDPPPAKNLMLTFEDVANNPLATGFLFRPRTAGVYEPIGADAPLPPNASLFPPSSYLIHQCPFGGGYLPTLHHIRAWNFAGEGEPDAVFHGYFTRR